MTSSHPEFDAFRDRALADPEVLAAYEAALERDRLPLAPWQRFYPRHVHCGGKFQIRVGRKGPRMICTCDDERADS